MKKLLNIVCIFTITSAAFVCAQRKIGLRTKADQLVKAINAFRKKQTEETARNLFEKAQNYTSKDPKGKISSGIKKSLKDFIANEKLKNAFATNIDLAKKFGISITKTTGTGEPTTPPTHYKLPDEDLNSIAELLTEMKKINKATNFGPDHSNKKDATKELVNRFATKLLKKDKVTEANKAKADTKELIAQYKTATGVTDNKKLRKELAKALFWATMDVSNLAETLKAAKLINTFTTLNEADKKTLAKNLIADAAAGNSLDPNNLKDQLNTTEDLDKLAKELASTYNIQDIKNKSAMALASKIGDPIKTTLEKAWYATIPEISTLDEIKDNLTNISNIQNLRPVSKRALMLTIIVNNSKDTKPFNKNELTATQKTTVENIIKLIGKNLEPEKTTVQDIIKNTPKDEAKKALKSAWDKVNSSAPAPGSGGGTEKLPKTNFDMATITGKNKTDLSTLKASLQPQTTDSQAKLQEYFYIYRTMWEEAKKDESANNNELKVYVSAARRLFSENYDNHLNPKKKNTATINSKDINIQLPSTTEFNY